jgi:hypothetical protein
MATRHLRRAVHLPVRRFVCPFGRIQKKPRKLLASGAVHLQIERSLNSEVLPHRRKIPRDTLVAKRRAFLAGSFELWSSCDLQVPAEHPPMREKEYAITSEVNASKKSAEFRA